MKRAHLIAVIGIALAALGLSAPLCHLRGHDSARLSSRQVQSVLGRPVEFGALSLRTIPLSLRATNLEIKGLATVELLDAPRPPPAFAPRRRGDRFPSSLPALLSIMPSLPVLPILPPGVPPPSLNNLQIIDGKLDHHAAPPANAPSTPGIDSEIQTTGNQTIGTVSWKNGTLPINLVFAARNNAGQWTVSRLDAKMGNVTAAFTGQIDANASRIDGALTVKPSPARRPPHPVRLQAQRHRRRRRQSLRLL